MLRRYKLLLTTAQILPHVVASRIHTLDRRPRDVAASALRSNAAAPTPALKSTSTCRPVPPRVVHPRARPACRVSRTPSASPRAGAHTRLRVVT
ncbi:hypothetical protein B0H15DRAFT_428689 [Mycena belliarum]|uniref:Uncharacterized protein n=1 Tax=Mycena belliarum TaxID=1033014 RepID=A0AAD6TXN9_9AGAR|nr:hypothetical protein B0H15DRAFT_428689 [Mycena belliae]